MKKLLILPLLVICLSLNRDHYRPFGYTQAYRFIHSTIERDAKRSSGRYQRWRDMSGEYREYIAGRIAEVATNVCDIYQLDLKVFIKHMKKESRFRYWCYNSKGAVGLMQPLPQWHSGKLYVIQNGDLGKYLLKRKREGKPINHIRYFKRINYNLHVAGLLYRQWLKKYNENYSHMLATYLAGHSHPLARKLRKNNDVLSQDIRLYRDIRWILE